MKIPLLIALIFPLIGAVAGQPCSSDAPVPERVPLTLEKAKSIQVDEVRWNDISFEEAIEWLRKTVQADDTRKAEESRSGLTIAALGSSQPSRLTLTMTDVSLDTVLTYLARLSGRQLVYTDDVVKLLSPDLAGDIVIRVFPVNPSFPNQEDLLKQEPPKHEGREVRIPYMLCGVLSKEQVLKYARYSDNLPEESASKITLPNGGVAEVTIGKEQASDSVERLNCAIRLAGPGSDRAEMTVKTYDGNGILIRCDAGGRGDPQLAILQIQEKD